MLNSVDGLSGALGETPFLLMGVALLAVLVVAQIVWAYRNRTGTGAGSAPAKTEIETDSDSDGEMMICPECGEPTEVEYRLCRHCAEDTGRSYVGLGGDDGSESSGML
jgi:hypothetical protein